MKRVLLSAVQLCAVAVITNAQIINGDRNHNARLDVQDITMLISDYTTGNQEIISGNIPSEDGTSVKVTMPVSIPERTVSIDTILRIEEKWLQVRVPVEIPDQMIQTDDQDVTIEVGGQLVSFVVPGQRIVLPAQMVEAETDVYIPGDKIQFFATPCIPEYETVVETVISSGTEGTKDVSFDIPEYTLALDTILRTRDKMQSIRVPVEIPEKTIRTNDQPVTIEVGGQAVSFVVPGQRIVLPAQMVEAETDVYIRGEEIRFFIGRTIPAQHITTTIKMEATEEPTPSTPGAVVFNTETGSGQTR